MIKSKACRRALSALVAVVLFFGTLPMLEISETIEELDFYSVRASGAEEFVDDDTDTQYQPSASGFVELTTDKIVAYSKRAHLYHKAHQNEPPVSYSTPIARQGKRTGLCQYVCKHAGSGMFPLC